MAQQLLGLTFLGSCPVTDTTAWCGSSSSHTLPNVTYNPHWMDRLQSCIHSVAHAHKGPGI